MRKFSSFTVLITVLIVLAILSKPLVLSAATSASRPDIKTSPEKTGGSWESEWNRVLEAAKKEGKVLIYSSPGSHVLRPVANAFEKKFGIKVEWINGRGEELTQRIEMEKVAGIRAVDVIMAGDGTTMTVMKPRGILGRIGSQLLLPEVKDPQSWVTKRVPFYDKDQMGIGMLATFQRYVLINTTLVRDNELTSYKDLLNPKWKGKITINDPTIVGTGNGFIVMLALNIWGVEEAKDFMRQFVRQEPAITRERRLQAEGVARGKYAISVATHFESAIELINLGAPLAFAKIKEGGKIGSGGGGLAVPETPAHPNASKVFVNWVLSKEGHAILVKAHGSPGSRKDAPREGIPPQMFAEPDEKFCEETEESILYKDEMIRVAKEIFAPLLK